MTGLGLATSWQGLAEIEPADSPRLTAASEVNLAQLAFGGPGTALAMVSAAGLWSFRSPAGDSWSFFFGDPGDTPLLGDWNRDGIDTVAMYRRSNGFVYLRNLNATGVADQSFFFGLSNDIPLAGDWDGDGLDTFAIYRPSQGRLYLRDTLGTGFADRAVYFGVPGDVPFAGDFDGDGVDTVGLYRAASGFAYLTNDLAKPVAPTSTSFYYGNPGDQILAGDWDDDGDETVGIFRPSNATFYLSNRNQQGVADVQIATGGGTGVPVAGRFLAGLPPLPPLKLEKLPHPFTKPVFLNAPAGDSRLFVVEQGGWIRVVADGRLLTQNFLDVSFLVSTGAEQGLLGLAFHPSYASNGRFFVDYTDIAGDTQVIEYRVSADANRADPVPVKTLLTVNQPASNHNGGMLQFGPDGKLYLSLGDGGGSAARANAQNPASLLGSIVSIDVDTGANQVWAKGLRNPWRFDFDPPTNTIFIGDVGERTVEEVNAAPAAAGNNFGWPIREGSGCFGSTRCQLQGLVPPVTEYYRADGCTVIGGFAYRGTAIPSLAGTFLYSDFCGGFLRGVRAWQSGWIDLSWPAIQVTGSPSSFGEDGHGELYLTTLDGSVYRIVPG